MTATAWAAFNGRTEMLRCGKRGPTSTRPGMTKAAPRICWPWTMAREAVRWFWSAGVDLQRRDAQGRNAHDLLVHGGRDVPGDVLERVAGHAALPTGL
jgi:hypothetical protein